MLKTIVAYGAALAVLIILLHPATIGPAAKIDSRTSGKVHQIILLAVLAAFACLSAVPQMLRGLPPSHPHFLPASRTGERLALFCTHLC